MNETPRWDLLPGHPEEFFGLQDPYTRNDLKRSYNVILRRYKPEQFPEEFQRLRAAFEVLEEALRHGTRPTTLGSSPAATQAPVDAASEDSRNDGPSIAERLKALGELGLRAELEGLESRTPSEWIALGLLREVAANAEPLVLHETLMQGIIATQGDDLVVHTLLGACRDPLSTPHAGKLVQTLARWIQEDSPDAGGWFYFASTPLWLSLVRKVPFEKFKSLLERCRERVGIDGNAGYLVLTLRLLRTGALKADSEWIEAAMEDLAERYEDLPGDLREEVDILEWLHAYMDQRESFLARHPGREEWDAALVAILSEEEPEADRAFLVATSAALDEPGRLLEAFPLDTESVGCALTPLYSYSEEVFARSREPEAERSPEQLRRIITPFLFRLEKIGPRTLTGKADELINFVMFALIISGLFIPAALLGSHVSSAWVGGLTILGVVLGFFGGGRIESWLYSKHTGRMYRNVWRAQVREFLEANPMHYHEFIEGVEAQEEKGLTQHFRLASQLHGDAGMALYALSLRFA
ncbi:MAG: hypothetical protein JKY61_06435 [Planctomycetes bacterium]|nr:hypothetical protein [Planctomycetota bacterium]